MTKISYQKSKLDHSNRLSRKDKKSKPSKRKKNRSRKRKAYKRLKKAQGLARNPFCSQLQSQLSVMDIYSSYWKNYCNVKIWQKTCLQVFNSDNIAPSANSRATFNVNEWPSQDVGGDYNDSEQEDSSVDEESNLQFVVQDDMLKFMEISMRHKEEMRLKREKESGNLDSRGCAISERDNIKDCLAPQGKSFDAKRLEEMQDLYGDSTAKIMGMETALQLTFNRNCDLYKPSYWPILPFKFKFS